MWDKLSVLKFQAINIKVTGLQVYKFEIFMRFELLKRSIERNLSLKVHNIIVGIGLG